MQFDSRALQEYDNYIFQYHYIRRGGQTMVIIKLLQEKIVIYTHAAFMMGRRILSTGRVVLFTSP